jgi:hypothetical protein
MTSRKKGRIGSSFDNFLQDEGVYNEVETVAVKRVIAWQRRGDEGPTHEQITNGAPDENKPEPAGSATGSLS